MTERWKLAEMDYARRARTASREERRTLYAEATGEVARLCLADLLQRTQF